MINVPKFLVHSKGDNWIHFRKDLDSGMESFTVTFIYDGTVVMTGDYGTLSWQRDHFPKTPDYGFPGNGTNIGYFTEKISQYGIPEKIKEFKKEYFIDDVKEFIKNNGDEKSAAEDAEKLQQFLEDIHYKEDFQEYEILEEYREHFEDYDYSEMGHRYTEHFVFMFECLKSVSADINMELRRAADEEVERKQR